MSKFSFVGPSYTARSNYVADEECINFFAETVETPGAQTQRAYYGTPGLAVFATFDDGPVRGQCWTGNRHFVAAYDSLYEVFADGTKTKRMTYSLDVFGGPVSIAASNIELLIVADGQAWCYELADNTFTNVTSQLAGGPVKVKYSDGYFIVMFADSNKFQISAILDGRTWPGIQVNAVSVFPENIVSIEVSHRELWVIGSQHAQPYQDTGTDEIFDVIPGALIETGGAATFGVDLLDNTVFWISEDSRGARQAWRANGYTPLRISTHAVEAALSSYSRDAIKNLVCYSYQDGGHLFWVLYIPGTDCTWVYDVAESLWHKRAKWERDNAVYTPHRSWNHAYAFGKHLVGDWETGTLWEMSLDYVDDNGTLIRRLRRSPTLNDEAQFVYHNELVVDFKTGEGIQVTPNNGGHEVTDTAVSQIYVNATGDLKVFSSEPLSPTFVHVLWSNFSIPSTYPADAVIRGIYPVIVASAHFDNVIHTYRAYGGGAGAGIFFTLPFDPHNLSFPSTEFYYPGSSGVANPGVAGQSGIGNTLSALTGIQVEVELSSSISQSGLTDESIITGVGFAIYYTSATPIIDPQMPAPFAVPPGMGVVWALPFTETDTGTQVAGLATGTPAVLTLVGNAWSNPLNILVKDGGYASITLTSPPTSDALDVTDFDFEIPNTMSVTGVQVNLWGLTTSAATVSAQLIVNGTPTGSVKTLSLPTSYGEISFGSISDLWGDALAYSDVNNDTFGVRLIASTTAPPATVDLDYVEIVLGLSGDAPEPQCMLQWSDDGGATWSNEHWAGLGKTGEYKKRVIWRRLGRARHRVYAVSVAEPISVTIVDAYLKAN